MTEFITYQNTEHEKIPHPKIYDLNIGITFVKFVKVHSHTEFEISLVLSGTANVKTPHEDYVLGPGEVAFFPKYLPHSFSSLDDDCCILYIQVGSSFCSTYYPQIETLSLEKSNILELISSDDDFDLASHIRYTCFNLAYNYFAQKNGYEFRCISDINRFFGYIISSVPHSFLSESDIMNAVRADSRINKILKYIDKHFTEKILLTDIAEKENLSVQYLSQLFHKYLNMTFQEYIKMLRVGKAEYLLTKTDFKLADICIESGFSDPKYLNAAFKDLFNTTPAKYRKEHSMDRKQSNDKSTQKTGNLQSKVPFEKCIDILRKYHDFYCDNVDLMRANN